MNQKIHSTAVIDASATVPSSVELGAFCVIGPNVRLGEHCVIGHHVVVHADTVVGSAVRIDDGAVLGKKTMRAVNSAVTDDKPRPPLKVGDECLIGAHVVLYRGAQIGRRCLIADLAGVREDSTVGEGTIVGRGAYVENACRVGAFVKIETQVYVTAYSEVGDRAFLAPMVTTTNDNYVGRSKKRFEQFKGAVIHRGGRVGANATLLPGATVEEDALVAAGSILRGAAPAGMISMGQPAKPLRKVAEDQRLSKQGWADVDESKGE
jgi:acetyltransferase-like isoleucine patch superfamily enzyme